jgi:purine-binding chemotaxis protein CheW
MAESADALRDKLHQLATEDTFLNAYARRRAGDQYDRELITFGVGGEVYGVDIGQTREIIKLRPITEVPRVPAFVKGVVAVRGQVIPAIDLRLRLGLPETPLTRRSRIMVCNVDDEPHGLIVDSVSSVVRLKDENIETPPAMGGGAEADFLSGIGRVGEELIILLDLGAVVRFSVEVKK